MMLTCIKQHLSNIWSSIHEKVKQHWGWVEKKCCLIKSVYLDLLGAVNKKISELKMLSTKKVQSMAIWSKFVSGNANKKHSGGSSQDVDVEESAVIPIIYYMKVMDTMKHE